MTVSKAYLRQMRADQEYRRRKAEFERLDDPLLLRLLEIDRHYGNPDDPTGCMIAQFEEVISRYVADLGLCDDCLDKLPDPLTNTPAVARNEIEVARDECRRWVAAGRARVSRRKAS